MDKKCQNWKMTFRAIQSNPALISTIPGKVHAKIEKKLLTSFWENALNCKKGTILTFKKEPLYRFNQILLGISCKCHPKEKKRESYCWSVSEIGPPPPPPHKVDADDDRWVSIWKAPLPGGTAELSSSMGRTRASLFSVSRRIILLMRDFGSLWNFQCGLYGGSTIFSLF